MSKEPVTLDDLEDDFEAAVVEFAAPIIAECEAAIAGKSDMEVAQYFLDSAKEHKANLLAIENCPEIMLEMADQHIAGLEAKIVWITGGKPNRREGYADRRGMQFDSSWDWPIKPSTPHRRRDCDHYADGERGRRKEDRQS